MSWDDDLTLEEVAAELKQHVVSIRKKRRAGEFPAAYNVGGSKAGARWRIPRADVEAFKARHRAA